MIKKKKERTRGKIQLSRYFQEFKNNDRVSIIREHAKQPKFPKRLQGRTGIITGKRGQSYIIELKDSNKKKTFIIHPVHLKKLK